MIRKLTAGPPGAVPERLDAGVEKPVLLLIYLQEQSFVCFLPFEPHLLSIAPTPNDFGPLPSLPSARLLDLCNTQAKDSRRPRTPIHQSRNRSPALRSLSEAANSQTTTKEITQNGQRFLH